MRNTLIFAGSSCPELTNSICSRLSMAPAAVDLSQFANGETSVKILTSIREKDVYVVQSGSNRINDSIMELLILISACKGSSANKITAILPYFPYSRQSKKKSHRGAITARMLANLLHVAGINHVITVDLHASQMQGFFRCPVDNLHAEPLIARWIKLNVRNWKDAVCVSKNAGGTKRVTSLADALKLNFGMVTTDKKRGGGGITASIIMSRLDGFYGEAPLEIEDTRPAKADSDPSESGTRTPDAASTPMLSKLSTSMSSSPEHYVPRDVTPPRPAYTHGAPKRLPLRSMTSAASSSVRASRARAHSTPTMTSPIDEETETDYTDERARDITHGRLVHGHIVPDDYPSPTQSAMSTSMILERPDEDPMELSRASSFYNPEPQPSQGGSAEAGDSSDEEEKGFKDPVLEQMITLVGDVRGRTVFLVDDMIDKAGSWIAAAETVVKRGGARKVYCFATHGLFGGDALAEMEACDCINTIVVTNSFPIPEEKISGASKLVVLDLSNLLSEAVRRNHYGESISALYSHTED